MLKSFDLKSYIFALVLVGMPGLAQALSVTVTDLGDPLNPVVLTDTLTPGQILARNIDLVTAISLLNAKSGKGSGHFQSLNFNGQLLYPRGGSLRVTISDTDYLYRDTGRAFDRLGVPAYFFGTGRVQSHKGDGFSSVSWDAWIDPGNTLFGVAHQIGSASTSTTGVTSVVWGEGKTRVPLADGQRFSITQTIQISMDEINPYLAEGFTYQASIRTTVVPLPASLPMLIAGLGLLGWRARRSA